jgi:hypothetical protein
MDSIEPSLGSRVLAGEIQFNGTRATDALRRYLKAIGEPDRPVVWAFREQDIVALLAGTSARGVARFFTYEEWHMASHACVAAADFDAGNAALRDVRDWQVVAVHLVRAGLPHGMCGEAVLIAAEGLAADYVLRMRNADNAPKAAKRLDRMVAARDATAAGVWAMWLTGGYVVAMSRPTIHYRDVLPHAEDGPAITFAGGMAIHAWNGVYVPEAWVIEQPSRITPEMIVACRDGRVGAVALERYGFGRFVVSPDSELVSDEPGIGRLFRRFVRWNFEVFAAVEVVNSTPELDGSHRRYVLSVPEHIATAREAVAWTFGLDAHEYQPDTET